MGARRSGADAVIWNGAGLLGMRERVELYGGTLVMGSSASGQRLAAGMWARLRRR